MQSFKNYLAERLKYHNLPGQQAQLKMAPSPLSEELSVRELEAGPDAKKSSVLVLLTSNKDRGTEILLTVRSDYIDHSGQISFPGGRSENGETEIETALRETHEEVGIDASEITVLGLLTKLYVNKSNNLVQPVVGFIDKMPELFLDPYEVKEAFTIQLKDLIQQELFKCEEWNIQGYSLEVPFWDIHEVPLWGATAMMMSELLEIYKDYLQELD